MRDRGTYNANQKNAFTCLRCDDGFESTLEGTRCKACPSDETTQGVEGGCICKFPKIRSQTKQGCVLHDCEVGYYASAPGNYSVTPPTCTACPVGFTTNVRNRASNCNPIPDTMYNQNTSTTPEVTNQNTSTTPEVTVESDELGWESQYTPISTPASPSVVNSCGCNYGDRLVVSLAVMVVVAMTHCLT